MNPLFLGTKGLLWSPLNVSREWFSSYRRKMLLWFLALPEALSPSASKTEMGVGLAIQLVQLWVRDLNHHWLPRSLPYDPDSANLGTKPLSHVTSWGRWTSRLVFQLAYSYLWSQFWGSPVLLWTPRSTIPLIPVKPPLAVPASPETPASALGLPDTSSNSKQQVIPHTPSSDLPSPQTCLAQPPFFGAHGPGQVPEHLLVLSWCPAMDTAPWFCLGTFKSCPTCVAVCCLVSCASKPSSRIIPA